MSIAENFKRVKSAIPDNVKICVVVKRRIVSEIKEVIEAGAEDIGINYIQEGLDFYTELGELAKTVNWHLIGHLQTNKINKIIPFISSIQTIASYKHAEALSKRLDHQLPVCIEINSAFEKNKKGVIPDDAEQIIRACSTLPNIKINGLMTMGAYSTDPEDMRPYFRHTKQLYDYISNLKIDNVELETLSMGMSDSYQTAIEEGANFIRPGRTIFV
ncbi:MAG: YggS family pyridoxal phosphate-dependent enzyme [Kiritimatiellae bacterium]|jgi:pyridoxal phosphate enzyme (YggS family)|nr:YggS family pyridoxal phosphate-dependent enzyme [Kiritimatiellia bacterium]